MYDVCRRMWHMRKNNKPVYSENLTSGQTFFKEGLIWSGGTDLVKNCSIAYTLYAVYWIITNFENLKC